MVVSRLKNHVKFDKYGTYLYTEDTSLYDLFESYTDELTDYHNLGIGVVALLSTIAVVMCLAAAGLVLRYKPEPSTANELTSVVLIPGVNDFIPVEATIPLIVSVIIAMFVHEAGHGISAYLDDLEVTETGVFAWTIVPLGAYVKIPSVDEDFTAPLWPSLRCACAGILNNMVVVLITTVLLLLPQTANLVDVTIGFFTLNYPTIGFLDAVLFWTWMINLNLALFNALPIKGLDGGHVIKHLEIANKLPDGTHYVTTVVVLASVAITIFYPIL